MRRVQVSEIASVLEEVQKGETFEVVDGDKLVATLSPPEDPQKELKEHIERLIAEGKATRGTGKLSLDFLKQHRLDIGGGAVEELLKEREEGW